MYGTEQGWKALHALCLPFSSGLTYSTFIYLYVFFVLLYETHKSTYPRTPVKTAKGSKYWKEITHNTGLKKRWMHCYSQRYCMYNLW